MQQAADYADIVFARMQPDPHAVGGLRAAMMEARAKAAAALERARAKTSRRGRAAAAAASAAAAAGSAAASAAATPATTPPATARTDGTAAALDAASESPLKRRSAIVDALRALARTMRSMRYLQVWVCAG